MGFNWNSLESRSRDVKKVDGITKCHVNLHPLDFTSMPLHNGPLGCDDVGLKFIVFFAKKSSWLFKAFNFKEALIWTDWIVDSFQFVADQNQMDFVAENTMNFYQTLS